MSPDAPLSRFTDLSIEARISRSGSGSVVLWNPWRDKAARLADLPAPTGVDCLVAGPEGGFEADEIAALHAAGAIPIRLGPRVLRGQG